MPISSKVTLSSDTLLPLTVLSRYLHFLARRPVSASNRHFRISRLLALQKLAPLLERSDTPAMGDVIAQLCALTPSNLDYLAPKLQNALREIAGAKLPRQFLVSSESPAPELFTDVSRVSIVFGPAIGIGDEILCFPLAKFFQCLFPEARIEVASMYDGLWDGVEGVRNSRGYADLSDMLEILNPQDDPQHLSCLIDFELPGLVPAVARDGRLARYIELSVGYRSAAVLDVRNQILHRSPELSVSNFYHALTELQDWIAPSPPRIQMLTQAPRTPRDQRGPLQILVSPFSSKEDPSLRYWSELLSSIVPRNVRRDVNFLIDTGPNHETESFAVPLNKHAEAQLPARVCYTLVPRQSGRFITVPETIALLENVDAVLAADSFLAHAAAYQNRLACILARAGLENWRAPAPTNFYFRLKDSAADVALGIRLLLSRLLHSGGADVRESAACHSLVALSAQLARMLASEEPVAELVQTWQLAQSAYYDVLSTVRDCPKSVRVLLSDHEYDRFWIGAPRNPDALGAARETLVRSHLRNLFNEWANTNLYKYLHQEKSANREWRSTPNGDR